MPVTTDIGPCECCGDTVSVACCSDPISQTLTAEFTAASTDAVCSTVLGTTFPLIYNTISGKWEGSFVINGNTIVAELSCLGSGLANWRMSYTATCNGGTSNHSPGSGSTCSPLLLNFSTSMSACCSSAFGFTLAVTL